MSEADVETVRRSYEALNDGDVDAALEALDSEAVWRDSPELPGGGEFRGLEALGGFLGDFLAEWRDFHQEIENVVVVGDRVALVIHLSAVGRSSGIAVDTRYAHVWTMREGRGVRVDAYRTPEAGLRELEDSA
ncbi:MAG TPA: nuclear transport factor 2 family protein [Solirubrobacterales bacterium]